MKQFGLILFMVFSVVDCLAGEISVTIKNIKNSEGQIILEFYRDADAFKMREGAYKSIGNIVIIDKQAKIKADLEPGRYAISLWHDENHNGAMDFNEYLQPKEGWGVSKNRWGFPDFKSVSFEVTEGLSEQVIGIRYPSKVTFQVQGLRNTKGTLLVGIYDNSQDFLEPGKALTGANNIAITGNSVAFEFMLLRGSYAATIVHDENANGELDKNLFGLPKEGFGFSSQNSSGSPLPSFGDASFFVGKGKVKDQVIKIDY